MSIFTKVIANFVTNLTANIAVGGTSAIIASNTTKDGGTLPNGKYCFTINQGKSNEQHILCNLVGTDLTSIQNVDRLGNITTGAGQIAKINDEVKITDFVNLKLLVDDVTALNDTVSGLVVSGSPDSSTTQKGVVRLTSSPNTSIGNVTMTIASPVVVTLNNHGLTIDDSVTFTTTGALPTGITLGATYYVLATDFTLNTFKISSSIGGSAINTSGTQSGIHTVTRTTPRAVSENDSKMPTQGQKDAMAGTGGTPSPTNRFITEEGTFSLNTFGDGSDGAAVLDGTNTYAFLSKAGSIYTMTRDIYCTDLTINSGSFLKPSGFRIFVKGTFSGSGTIQYNGSNGGNASGMTGGAAGAALSTTGFFKNIAGTAGSNGALANGVASTATAGGNANPSIGASGSAGSRGGGRADAPNTTPTAGAKTSPSFRFPVLKSLVIPCIDVTNTGTIAQILGSAGSSGGSGGHGYTYSGLYGNVSGDAGGGGGAGSTGGTIFLVCKVYAGTVTFEATGGNGGNGVNNTANGGGGGGGAGAAGGVVVVVYGSKTATPVYTLTGGTGGTGGTNGNAPNIPTSGANGNTGISYEIPISSLL